MAARFLLVYLSRAVRDSHPSEVCANICHAQCAGVERDSFRHGNLIGQRHFVARSPVLSAPKGPNISAQGNALSRCQGKNLALKGNAVKHFEPINPVVFGVL